VLSDRLRTAVETWRARDITSNRMLGTGAAILVIGVPLSLWYLLAGPTGGDRLVSLGFLVVSLVLGLYSLWEAKAPGPPDRSDLDEDRL
jgi:hypothetical protein